MFFNAYMEKDPMPSEDSIEKDLGKSYRYFLNLLKQTDRLNRKLVFSKPNGWSIKIYDVKKALCYIYISEDMFRVYMTLREWEKEELMDNPNVRFAYKKLGESKQFSEGFAITYDVKDDISSEKCSLFIKEVMLLRLPYSKRKRQQLIDEI